MKYEEYIDNGEIETTLTDARAPEMDKEVLQQIRQENRLVEKEAEKTEVLLEDLALSHRLNPNPWVKDRIFGSISWGNPFFF